MKQEHRLVLAIGLSALIMVLYQTYFAPKPEPLPEKISETTVTPSAVEIPPAAKTPVPAGDSAEAADASFHPEPRRITVATDKVNAVIDTRGGVITSWRLRDYRTKARAGSPEKDLLETEGSRAFAFGLDGYPGLGEGAVWDVGKEERLEGGGRAVRLVWRDKNLAVEKTIAVGDGESAYLVRQSFRVRNLSGSPIRLTPAFTHNVLQKPHKKPEGFFGSMFAQRPDIFGGQFLRDDKIENTPAWDKFSPVAVQGDIPWAGISDRYFLLASFDGMTPPAAEVAFARDGDFLTAAYRSTTLDLNPGTEAGGVVMAYLGPKELAQLSLAPVQLKRAVDYGWFGIVAVPILWLMGGLHRFIPNWGLVIIALTLIVKVLLHPVNKKSMTSMKAMQQLQPKLAEIKKRHPDNPQKQNEETMQLFRTHKVSPLGGCLPMLAQMPIYIALYNVLWNAIELYHAPFLWYDDLSAPDPYFVAPALLGVFMYFQQKLTPSASADPAQQKMMAFMPVMFTVFMLFLPVGLVIYIFVNTLMSVVQQFMLQRDLTFKDLVTGKWQPNGA